LNAANRTQAASIANRLLSQPTPAENGWTSSRTETEVTGGTAFTDLLSGSTAVPVSGRNGYRPMVASPNSGSTADQMQIIVADATHTQGAG
jgi:hypothetical protein